MARKNKGVTPPQQGRIVQAAQAPDNTAGRKAQVAVAGYVPMHAIKSGAAPKSPPQSVGSATVAERGARSGADPYNGTLMGVKGAPMHTAAAGTAPTDKKNGGVRSKVPSDTKQIKTDDNTGSYAKGGKINRHGNDTAGLNAGIPIAQPGGNSSTGVIAKGTMGATGDTHLDDNTGDAPQSKPVVVMPPTGLRGPTVKRAGAAPSLPRPRR